MVVYSIYIFDRHTECIYSKSWLPPSPHHHPSTVPPSVPSITTTTGDALPPVNGGTTTGTGPTDRRTSTRTQKQKAGDDAKLIFGTVFSLRNMVRKLGGEDDAFISYRTAQYKLHYYETVSNLRFVMLTDTATMSMRNVLHQIYINLWVEYVVKNPLSPVEHKGGEGVKNELFELGLDQFVRGLM
ncbi:sybindin-like family protein [Diplogelasinospora grovesii]|uniref:Trafficking protein particle complex subunit n=1 Tax=Diplogelasinospora grovesii TaxID=303347 RepID=A0AAN6N7A1_9PEZI|nr:sybindin-like family protein [Diplogelasinospora grovesii]